MAFEPIGVAMKIKEVRPQSFVSKLKCDRCGAEAQHDAGDGFNNILQIELDTSWGSALGDGNHVEVDMCHECLKDTLGAWLRVTPAAWTRVGDPARSAE